MSEQLLPCPFCGSEVRLGCDDYSTVASQNYYIECQGPDCLIQDMYDLSYGALVAAWNRRAALTPSPQDQQAEAVRVKPLEWDEDLKGRWIGTPTTKLGDLSFWIFFNHDGSFKRATKDGWQFHPDLDAAKAAAQAYYEARILSCISPQADAAPSRDEALREAASDLVKAMQLFWEADEAADEANRAGEAGEAARYEKMATGRWQNIPSKIYNLAAALEDRT